MSKKSAHKEKEISLIINIKRKLFFFKAKTIILIKVYTDIGMIKKKYFLPSLLIVIHFYSAKISIEWQGNVYFQKWKKTVLPGRIFFPL